MLKYFSRRDGFASAKHNLNKSNPSSLRYAGQVKFYRSRQYFFRKSKGLNPPLSLLQEGDIVFSCNIRFVLLSSQIKCVVPSAEVVGLRQVRRTRRGKVGWVWRLLSARGGQASRQGRDRNDRARRFRILPEADKQVQDDNKED